jgi:1-acyl-sn-glycerol-3-phosphate acyltransferase
VALRWFYRSIEIVDAQRLPRDGAVLLASNHPNAMVDAMVIAATSPRVVRLTAKATLLRNPLMRIVLHSLGIVPLRRASDETAVGAARERNAEAFRAVTEVLRSRGVVLIFPEGRSHSEPSLAELKTGCARIALEARAQDVAPLVVLPVGLAFERKDRPRSRVAVIYGEPIEVTETVGPLPHAVTALTERIDAGMRDVTLNVPSLADAERVLQLSHAISGVLSRLRPLEATEPPLAATIELARRVEFIRRRLPELSVATVERVAAFTSRLDDLRSRLTSFGIPLTELWLDIRLRSGLWFAVRELVVFGTLFPIALWGRISHWVPLRLASFVGRWTSRHPDEPAMYTLLAGLVTVALAYSVMVAWVQRYLGWFGSVAFVASLPLSASLDFWLTDRWQVAQARAGAFFQFRANPGRHRALVAEAAALRAEADRLDILLQSS